MEKNPAPVEFLQFVMCSCKKTKCTPGQCQYYAAKLKCIDLCSCAKCENMVGDHDNDEEIGEQGASDDDYDSGTDGREHSSGESDSKDDMTYEDD